MAGGLTDNEIGEQIYVSARTVQHDLTRVREKTGLRRRSELVRWAAEHSSDGSGVPARGASRCLPQPSPSGPRLHGA